jgi:regulation of enolase protein 1 (concanavalin A-like superfamily)
MSFACCSWVNAPSLWCLEGENLHVVTDAKTDFWRQTYYSFTRDTGHFFARRVVGDFTAQLRVRARYEELYDQAGMMIRIDESNWIKAGIEMSDGQALLSSVITIQQSDWAAGTYGGDATDFWIRSTVKDGVLRVQVSADGRTWPLLRLAPFPGAGAYHVGPMCCTPERSGLEVNFSAFQAGPALDKELHDLS